jgi:hypothetical protein
MNASALAVCPTRVDPVEHEPTAPGERSADQPMKMYVPRSSIGSSQGLGGELVGSRSTLQLDQVVSITRLQPLAQPAEGPEFPGPAARRMPTDLKIEKIGHAVVTNQHVLAFLEIDVRHPPLVHFVQQCAKTPEEIVAHMLTFSEWMAFDVLPDDTCWPPAVDQPWHSVNIV